MYIPLSLRDTDEETGEDLHSAHDVYPQREQRALHDTTNGALNRPSANRDSNATGISGTVHPQSNFHALLTSFRASH